MQINENVELYALVWTIATYLGSRVAKKVHASLVEGVVDKDYLNYDLFSGLIKVELIGSGTLHVIVSVIVVLLDEGTLVGRVNLSAYVGWWLLLSVVYIIVIVEIVKNKTEGTEYRYKANVFFAMLINISIGTDLLAVDIDTFSAVIIVLVLLAIQFYINIESVQIKVVKYKIKTKNRKNPYIVHSKPRKSAGYFFISYMDINNQERKRVQIPESEVEEIEYIISDVVIEE